MNQLVVEHAFRIPNHNSGYSTDQPLYICLFVIFIMLNIQTVTVHMSEEDMDNFVFAVMPKKTAAKMQKELQDLVRNSRLLFSNTSYKV